MTAARHSRLHVLRQGLTRPALVVFALAALAAPAASINSIETITPPKPGDTQVGVRIRVADPGAEIAAINLRLTLASIGAYLQRSGASIITRSNILDADVFAALRENSDHLEAHEVVVMPQPGEDVAETTLLLNAALTADSLIFMETATEVSGADGPQLLVNNRLFSVDQTAPFISDLNVLFVATDNSFLATADIESRDDAGSVTFDMIGTLPSILIRERGVIDAIDSILQERTQTFSASPG